MSKRREREAERVLRLLRRLDLEEVLDDLGLDILWYKGVDAYMDCPDPSHEDQNPSFHVCIEETEDDEGRNLLGWFNCWSHPQPGLSSQNFLDLVARVKYSIWEDEDGEPISPTDEDRMRAASYLRSTYLRGERAVEPNQAADDALRKRERSASSSSDRAPQGLIWPPSVGIMEGPERFRSYLTRRGFPLERAVELGARCVERHGKVEALYHTGPAVLFPIVHGGEVVNWFARAIGRVDKKNKGRYAPGVKLAKAGVMWCPERLDSSLPVVMVEGLFDRERVYRVSCAHGLHVNVVGILGGRLDPAQARRLRGFPEALVLADGDNGGEIMIKSVEEHLGGSVPVRAFRLPQGTDPDDAPEELILKALQGAAGSAPADVEDVRFRFRYRRRR